MPVRSAVLTRAICVCLALGFACAEASAAEALFPRASRIGLVPPPGFVLSASFAGYQHNDKQASIIMADLPGYVYDTLQKEIAAEIEKNPGTRQEELQLAEGGRGILLMGNQTSPQGPVLKWTMVALAHDVTAVVTALIPEAIKDVAGDEAIRAAFASLTVRTSVPVEEQLSVLPFTMRSLEGFRIIRVQPGSAAMLTDGPKDAVEVPEQPLFVVSMVPGPTVQSSERDGFSRRLLGDVPGIKDIRVMRSEPLRLGGQQGHEVVIEAKDTKTGTDVSAVQWVRFGNGALLRMVGLVKKESWDATFQRFRGLRDGIDVR